MIIELADEVKELGRFVGRCKWGNKIIEDYMILYVIESADQPQYKVSFINNDDGRANGYVKFSTKDEAMNFINKRIENGQNSIRQYYHDMQTDAIFANSRV